MIRAIECKDFGTVAKISAQTLLPHAWRGCLEVTVPKTKGSVEKREVGLVNHTAKVFLKALRKRLSPVLEEAALTTQMGGLRARGCGPSIAFVEGLVASGGSQRQVSMRLVC